MILRISLCTAFYILLLSCKGINETENIVLTNYASIEHLIEAKELETILKESNTKIVDFRSPENYQAGHINGSINIWRTDISDNSLPYEGMRADRKQIELLFGRLGIENDDLIIVYDDKGSSDAARLWCILEAFNFDSVKILNGGLKSWESMGGKLTKELYTYTPSQFQFSEKSNENLWIDKEELRGLFSDVHSNITIVDTRNAEEYSGILKKKGASKAGRIPGSIHIDWAEAVDPEHSKKFRSIEELQKIYNGLEMNIKDTVIVYCHSGYRSSLTTYVLKELMGFENVRNYDGSWVEWSYFNDLPYEKDSLIL
ncbi:sulfurtransferase [uncultured Eudoraea sp.]|uniref:sulfurtransferase n=1 Tax=uncultured Eudoraea sp. TaxID=1035614 RepID=UPI00262587E3|nr:sulfurtransferase [uncultured Eudoraea sp.]